VRQGRIAALALPLPAANGQKMGSVRAVDLECHGGHERAGFTGARGAATAGGVTVVGGDDQPPPRGQALDEGPEVVA